ncbi:taurine ABC transporter substrate-binding protein [Kiloniella sp. b19]|uniref:taurine ABC transporter substrate-binding protein n=1 Tax=Kiloniella sp. GXU_MW_B19 TaxID=3141326 RepID=UPI0031CE454A
MLNKRKLRGAVATMALVMGGNAAMAADELTVAYFLEWPMPFQYAKVQGLYEEALGIPINWVSFDTGTAMSASMASGDVQISLSQGLPPFVIAASAGQDLQIVDVAVSYSDNDNCVVADSLEIDKTNAKELEGKRVGIPIGTAAHYGFLKQMEHFKVDISTMEIVDMAPAEGAAAFAQGNLDFVCGFGGGLRRMQEHGNVLLTGAEKEELGILVFDVISTTSDFAAEEAELLTKFLKVTADANAKWNSNDGRAEMMQVIAEDAGMELADAEASIGTFTFPDPQSVSGDKWLGGGVQEFMKGVADVFANAGSIESAQDSYEANVNASFIDAVAKQ